MSEPTSLRGDETTEPATYDVSKYWRCGWVDMYGSGQVRCKKLLPIGTAFCPKHTKALEDWK